MGPVSEIPGQDLACGKGPGGPRVHIWINNEKKLLKMGRKFYGGMGDQIFRVSGKSGPAKWRSRRALSGYRGAHPVSAVFRREKIL